MKTGKATGPDEIPVELFKLGEHIVTRIRERVEFEVAKVPVSVSSGKHRSTCAAYVSTERVRSHR